MITHLLASDRVAVPWKNGGGVTSEVAASPPGAGMDDFTWRVSMAEVTQSGPFSCFPGVRRHLTVLRGRLRLDFAGRSHDLGPLDSLEFDGGTPVSGAPLEPVLDLNVMARGEVSATVRQVEGRAVLAGASALLFNLHSHDALLFVDESGRDISCNPSLLIEIAAAAKV